MLPMGGMPALATKPGRGMDPMQAMLNGLGHNPAAGMDGHMDGDGAGMPPGLPPGGTLQAGEEGEGMGGSALLAALHQAMGDPYATPPNTQPLEGIGQGDPHMGLEALLQVLALGQMGVGGGQPQGIIAGRSGVDDGLRGQLGGAVGL
jgi:hypothetical protein